MRLKGKLVKWNADKAFGFIQPNGGGDQVFIHKTALSNRTRTPKLNDIITFDAVKDNQNRYRAENATFSGEKLVKKQPKKVSKFSLYLASLFLSGIALGYAFNKVPEKIFYLYFAASFITFVAYAIDKSKAQNDGWRTQESTLHLFSLLGGWPGAAFAQQLLRHKSQKREFRLSYWFTVVVNSSVFFWLLTSHGATLLNKLPSVIDI